MIERIEFVPGSGASIYGANAFLGMINVVTKKGHAINGAQLAGEYGTFDTYKGRVTYGKKLDNGADVLVSASHYDSAGVENLYFPEFDTPATNNGIAHNMDVERSDRLFGRMQFQDFTFTGGFVDRLKRMPAAQFTAIFNDPATHSYDRSAFGNLKYEHKLSEDTSLQLRGFYQAYDYSVDVANNLLGPNISTNESTGRWWGGEAQLTSTLFDNHRVMVGVEYQYDQEQRLLQYMVDPYLPLHDSNRHGHRLELYAQDDIRLLDDLTFSAGLRLDYHHMLKQLQLNPRLGLIWNPLESTTFKLLYSSTFRAPNTWERDFDIPMFVFKANSNNYEELIKSYEAIAEWHSTSGLKLVADFFYNDISQLLQQAVVPGVGATGAFSNLGQYHAYGFELEAEQRWNSGRLLKSSYAYNQVTDEANAGVWADGSPRNVFKLHYAEPLFDGFAKLGIENIFVDERRTPQGGMADAYYQLNLNLTSDRLLNGLDVSFGVYNVLDHHYQMLGGTGFADLAPNVVPMNGREFRLKLQLTF